MWSFARDVVLGTIEENLNYANNSSSNRQLLWLLLCLDLSPPIYSVLLRCQRCQTVCTRPGMLVQQQHSCPPS